MLIAQQKRKENIAEYILYLYQIEDLIRAFRFNMQSIEEQLVAKYSADAKTKTEIVSWYKNLAVMMQKENVEEKGHLQFLANQINELHEFHSQLLEKATDTAYINTFTAVAGLITELKNKNTVANTDVQLSLDTIYGYLLLKMQNKEITEETTEAVKRLSAWLGSLSKRFKDYETGNSALE